MKIAKYFIAALLVPIIPTVLGSVIGRPSHGSEFAWIPVYFYPFVALMVHFLCAFLIGMALVVDKTIDDAVIPVVYFIASTFAAYKLFGDQSDLGREAIAFAFMSISNASLLWYFGVYSNKAVPLVPSDLASTTT